MGCLNSEMFDEEQTALDFVLSACGDEVLVSLLLQAGASKVSFGLAEHAIKSDPYYNCYVMILSARIDPGDHKIHDDLKLQVKQWLLSLEAAKECFVKVFDDPDLEK